MPDLSAQNLVPILLKTFWLEIGNRNEGEKDNENEEKMYRNGIDGHLLRPFFLFGLYYRRKISTHARQLT